MVNGKCTSFILKFSNVTDGLEKERTTAIGIMSGTSLDGLDLCYVEFEFDGKWRFEITASNCISYDEEWSLNLRNAHTCSVVDLELLNDAFGKFIGESVNAFIDKFSLQKPDIVCSHGHTVFHEPASKFTLQIGNGNIISETTGITCVSDFRSLDVSLGGQGAPLVPVGDQHLFSEYEACLNLGGFSNISFKERGERLAFDICPVNISLNLLANLLNKPFDYNGEIARSGHLQPELLKQMNALPIYKLHKRPSLAREWLEKVFNPVIENVNYSVEDKLRTVTEHVVKQISVVINSRVGTGRVLVTGGGTRNGFLMERLSQLSSVEVVIPNEEILDYKEALIFAFLGLLRMRDQNNVLRSVTGAQADSCSGVVSNP